MQNKKRYCMIWDNGYDCGGIQYDDLESAKEDAIEMLEEWCITVLLEYKMYEDVSEWTEKHIEKWNDNYYNTSCYVAEYNPTTDEYDIEIWYPSDDELKEHFLVDYDTLLKMQKELNKIII